MIESDSSVNSHKAVVRHAKTGIFGAQFRPLKPRKKDGA